MTTNRTFTMIKPDAVENGYIGKIIDMITEAGFEITNGSRVAAAEAQT